MVARLRLCLGVFSADALAGKKKKTAVVYFSGSPKINKGGKVTAKGSLNTASACKPARGMRLQVLDQNGACVGTLDGSTSDSSGNWALSGQLPSPCRPAPTRCESRRPSAPPGSSSARPASPRRWRSRRLDSRRLPNYD